MKFLLGILLTALLSFLAGLWFDWWIIAVVAFLVALLVKQKPGMSFLGGFLGIFLLWAVLAEWIDVANKSILSVRIATILPLGGNSLLLVMITGLIGGVVGGFAALTASYLRKK